jgi:hypothetical protein
MNEMLLTTNSATRAHALCDQFSSRQEVALQHSIMSEQVCIGLIVYGKRERCWVPATISRINEDSTFGVTLQVEALVDLIDNHTRLA